MGTLGPGKLPKYVTDWIYSFIIPTTVNQVQPTYFDSFQQEREEPGKRAEFFPMSMELLLARGGLRKGEEFWKYLVSWGIVL
jgi:hypothetical protein